MAKKNRLSATAQINDLVQEAVEQGDYGTLGDEVGDVIKTSIKTKVLYHEPGIAKGKLQKYTGGLLSILFGVPSIGSLIAWFQIGKTELLLQAVLIGVMFILSVKLAVAGKKKECLAKLTSQETYQEYLNRQKPKEQKEYAQTKQNKKTEILTKHQEVVIAGRQYAVYIHECRNRITDQQVYIKLCRLEQVISEIFCEVEKNPDLADDMKKMLNHYLPITKKLLTTYCEFENETVAAKNIIKMKQEIVRALDLLNEACTCLLDDILEKREMDISTDIIVLQNMLIQEGLLGSDFNKINRMEDIKNE